MLPIQYFKYECNSNCAIEFIQILVYCLYIIYNQHKIKT